MFTDAAIHFSDVGPPCWKLDCYIIILYFKSAYKHVITKHTTKGDINGLTPWGGRIQMYQALARYICILPTKGWQQFLQRHPHGSPQYCYSGHTEINRKAVHMAHPTSRWSKKFHCVQHVSPGQPAQAWDK